MEFAGNENAILNIAGGGTLGSNAFTSTAYAPIASPTFTGTVSSPITRLTNVTGVAGGTDSLLSKNATTNVITKIPASYYATSGSLGSYLPLTGGTMSGNINMGANSLLNIANIGVTGTRVTSGFFTDLAVTNTITGSISGNSATATNVAASGITGNTLASNVTMASIDQLLGLTSNGIVQTSSGTGSLSVRGTTGGGAKVSLIDGTLNILSGKTGNIDNSLEFTGTDGSVLDIGSGGTLGSAAFTSSSAYEVPLTFSTGLTRTVNTITVNTSQNIATLSNLTSNGLVTTSGSAGTLGVTVPGTGVLTALGNTAGGAGGFALVGGSIGHTLTFGTHLTSGGSSFNGSADVTITSDATSANTASAIVARDGSGNFTAGTITASLTGGASQVGVTNDVVSNSTVYPTWVGANSGNNPIGVSSTKLTFNMSTGILSSTSFTGAGTGLTGTAGSLSIGGNAATATTATNATNTAITDDNSTNATMYPTWVTANTGNLPQKVSSTQMTFNPSTGYLTTLGFNGTTGLISNNRNVGSGGYAGQFVNTNSGGRGVQARGGSSASTASAALEVKDYRDTAIARFYNDNIDFTKPLRQFSPSGAYNNTTYVDNSGYWYLGNSTVGTLISVGDNEVGNVTVTNALIAGLGLYTSNGVINGGASNITSGTGASRTMIFKTTTSGSSPTTALTLGADQSATFGGTIAASIINASGKITGSVASGTALDMTSAGGGANAGLITNSHATNPFGLAVLYTNASPNNNTNTFLVANDASVSRFIVYSNGGISNFSANNVNLSDSTTKRDISKAGSFWKTVKNTPVVYYRYKDESSANPLKIGVLAQDVQKSDASLVTTWGKVNDVMKLGVKDGEVPYVLWGTLQEAMQRIEVLEAVIKNNNLK